MDVWTLDTLGTAGMILLSCAGNNANTIHYIESVGGVEAGDPLLMDAGTEYQGHSWNGWNDSFSFCIQ